MLLSSLWLVLWHERSGFCAFRYSDRSHLRFVPVGPAVFIVSMVPRYGKGNLGCVIILVQSSGHGIRDLDGSCPSALQRPDCPETRKRLGQKGSKGVVFCFVLQMRYQPISVQ